MILKNVSHKLLARDEGRNFQIDITEIAPNTTLKEHIHTDVEWIYVIEGSFSDENGTYNKDDFVVFPKNSKHVSKTGEDGCKLIRCWCGTIIPA